jgi:predicted TIM-barrel fold metal-dependent hydrolase
VSRFTGFAELARFVQMAGIATLAPDLQDVVDEIDAVEILNQRFFFDMAGWSFPMQWKMLVKGLGIGFDRITYGTDYPFTSDIPVMAFGEDMDQCTKTEWEEGDIEKAYYGNAARLFGIKDNTPA